MNIHIDEDELALALIVFVFSLISWGVWEIIFYVINHIHWEWMK